MATPELQIPEGWEDRAPDGWDWQPLWEAVERGHNEFTHDFVTNAIETDIGPKIILDDGLFPGFNLQGDRFSEQIIFIPEMLITARAMKAGLALIRPLLAAMAEALAAAQALPSPVPLRLRPSRTATARRSLNNPWCAGGTRSGRPSSSAGGVRRNPPPTIRAASRA